MKKQYLLMIGISIVLIVVGGIQYLQKNVVDGVKANIEQFNKQGYFEVKAGNISYSVLSSSLDIEKMELTKADPTDGKLELGLIKVAGVNAAAFSAGKLGFDVKWFDSLLASNIAFSDKKIAITQKTLELKDPRISSELLTSWDAVRNAIDSDDSNKLATEVSKLTKQFACKQGLVTDVKIETPTDKDGTVLVAKIGKYEVNDYTGAMVAFAKAENLSLSVDGVEIVIKEAQSTNVGIGYDLDETLALFANGKMPKSENIFSELSFALKEPDGSKIAELKANKIKSSGNIDELSNFDLEVKGFDLPLAVFGELLDDEALAIFKANGMNSLKLDLVSTANIDRVKETINLTKFDFAVDKIASASLQSSFKIADIKQFYEFLKESIVYYEQGAKGNAPKLANAGERISFVSAAFALNTEPNFKQITDALATKTLGAGITPEMFTSLRKKQAQNVAMQLEALQLAALKEAVVAFIVDYGHFELSITSLEPISFLKLTQFSPELIGSLNIKASHSPSQSPR